MQALYRISKIPHDVCLHYGWDRNLSRNDFFFPGWIGLKRDERLAFHQYKAVILVAVVSVRMMFCCDSVIQEVWLLLFCFHQYYTIMSKVIVNFLFVLCLLVILVGFHFGFEGGIQYVYVSVLIKFSQNTSIFPLIIISSP